MRRLVAYGGVIASLFLTALSFFALSKGSRADFRLLGTMSVFLVFVTIMLSVESWQEFRGLFT
jgi:hypothetical protein